MTSICIITPWKNHLELAPDYFTAIHAGGPDQLIVVDNNSEPPLDFAALRVETGGFCRCNNVALELVETDAVLFLNNDIKARRATWLDSIREAIEPGTMVGPLRFDPHGNVDDISYPYVDGWCVAMTTEDAKRVRWEERYDEVGLSYFSDNAYSFDGRWEGLALKHLRPGLEHLGGRTGGTDPIKFNQAVALNQELWHQHVRARV